MAIDTQSGPGSLRLSESRKGLSAKPLSPSMRAALHLASHGCSALPSSERGPKPRVSVSDKKRRRHGLRGDNGTGCWAPPGPVQSIHPWGQMGTNAGFAHHMAHHASQGHLTMPSSVTLRPHGAQGRDRHGNETVISKAPLDGTPVDTGPRMAQGNTLEGMVAGFVSKVTCIRIVVRIPP